MPEPLVPLQKPLVLQQKLEQSLTREHFLGSASGEAGVVPKNNFQEYLVLTLGKEPYAIELSAVREIVNLPALTEVPRSAPDILGVCSVRGLLVTVVDLRRRLNLAAAAPERGARILLTQSPVGEDVGLLVDEVKQVVKLSYSELEPVQEMMAEPSPHIRGVFHLSGQVVILLNAQSVSA
jgi:purine-binding chemotaxis protein CheW